MSWYSVKHTDTGTVDLISTLGENVNLTEGSTIKDTLNRLAVRADFVLNG